MSWHRRALAKMLVGDGCWEWTGAVAGGGYGQLLVDGKIRYAHRLMYEWLVGPIPEGLVLDHICHKPAECEGGECAHRRCVRPDHLEVVTRGENVRRGHHRSGNEAKTRCPRSHTYSPENTYVTSLGHRQCKTCNRRKTAEYAARRKAAS